MPSLALSKSTYMRGLQCEKSLYLHKVHPELRGEISDSQEALFRQGTTVGDLARKLFPGGKDCSTTNRNEFQIAAERTQEYIRNGESVIYEAAFIHDQILVFADILVSTREGWQMYEVKSTTQVKDTHIKDASLQAFVIEKCGVMLKDIFIIHLNNQYVRNGDLDVDRLFTKALIANEARKLISEVPQNLDHIRSYLKKDEIPEKEIGPHCGSPYACDFMNYCWQDVPNRSVFEIARMKGDRKFDYFHQGIIRLADFPEEDHLSYKQRLQVTSEKTGETHINIEAIKEFVSILSYPLYFMDFETINLAIPLFDYSRPYEQIPFQYSLHFQKKKDGEIDHYEFLAETDGSDPRLRFIKRLISDCGTEGNILVYNKAFESGRLTALANIFHHYADEIAAIQSRMVDLMVPFQKGWYYTPDMAGSYSIKAVLPALVPELAYDDLEIENGGDASNIFAAMASGSFNDNIDEARTNLLAYCKMDTLAMVEILKKLNQIA